LYWIKGTNTGLRWLLQTPFFSNFTAFLILVQGKLFAPPLTSRHPISGVQHNESTQSQWLHQANGPQHVLWRVGLSCPHWFVGLIFDSERKIPFSSNAEAITPAVVQRQAPVGNPQLHRLPHAAGRRRLLCARAGQCVQAPWPGFHQGLDARPAHRHTRVAARCRSSTSREQLNDLVEFLRWTGGINTEKWPPTSKAERPGAIQGTSHASYNLKYQSQAVAKLLLHRRPGAVHRPDHLSV
jgi:nitric oxide reductase subunit C